MNETTKNFLEVWNNWKYEPPKPPVFRCYHREDGSIITYTTELLEGNFIEVDAATYTEHSLDAKVIGGKLQRLPKIRSAPKLKPSTEGISCDPWDVTIIVAPNQPNTKWRLSNESN